MELIDDDNNYPRSEYVSGICTLCGPWRRPVVINNDRELEIAINNFGVISQQVKNAATHEEIDPGKKGCKGHQSNLVTTLKKRKNKGEKKDKEKNNPIKQFTKTFADVIGLNNAKEELKDEVSTMTLDRSAAIYSNVEVGDGIILAGNPGIGKTLLAQTLVNETEFKGKIELYGEGRFFVKDFTGSSQESTSEKITDFFDGVENRYQDSKKVQEIIINEIDNILRYDRDSTINDARLGTFLSITGNNVGHYIIVGTTNKPLFNNATIRRGRFKLIYCDDPNYGERLMLAKKFLLELKIPMKLLEDDYITICNNTNEWVGSDYNNLKTDIFKWYNKSRRKGIIPSDYMVTIKDVVPLIGIENNRRKEESVKQEKILTEKKRPGRQNIEEPAMPVVHIPTNKEMAIAIAEWTNDTKDNVYKKYHVKFEYGGLSSADPELTREYNNLKKINDMKKEFDEIIKEE